MEQPLVSVVIPTYNRAALLREAVASVLAQDYPAIEVVVVDDGSTDNTAEAVKSLGAKIAYIRRSNGRTAAARNTGVEVAQGEFIAFLDHDDLWKPDKISRQMPLFADAGVGLVYSGAEFFLNDTGRITSVYRVAEETDFHQALGHQIIPLQSAVVRREVFARVGKFDVELKGTDDWDFCIRTALHYKTRAIADPLLRVRLHERNQSYDFAMMYRNCLKVLEKNGGAHGDCDACRQALRQSLAFIRQDHYIKLVTAAKKNWRGGARFSALKQAAAAIWTYPPAIPRIARKGLRRLVPGNSN